MYKNKDLNTAVESAQAAISCLIDVLEHFEDTLADKKTHLNEMREWDEVLQHLWIISVDDADYGQWPEGHVEASQ